MMDKENAKKGFEDYDNELNLHKIIVFSRRLILELEDYKLYKTTEDADADLLFLKDISERALTQMYQLRSAAVLCLQKPELAHLPNEEDANTHLYRVDEVELLKN